MSTSLKYSLILHLILALIFIIDFPSFRKNTNSEMVIAIDIIQVSKETNLKNTTKSQSSKNEKKEKEKETKLIKEDSKPIVKAPTKTAPKLPVKAPTPTKKSVEPTSKKPSKPKDEIESLLKDLEGSAGLSNSASSNTKEEKNSSTKLYDDTLPLSISEKDNIKNQIEKKFVNPVVLDFQPQELVIRLRLSMNTDGTIKNVTVLNSSIYPKRHSDTFVTLKNSLIRAAHIASPIQNLPLSKYKGSNGWEEIELTFDAHNLMNLE